MDSWGLPKPSLAQGETPVRTNPTGGRQALPAPGFASERARVEHLFRLYETMRVPLADKLIGTGSNAEFGSLYGNSSRSSGTALLYEKD